jgi:chromate reductase
VRCFKEALLQADAIIIATPEFNGSIPGVLKNALDWASRPYGESALAGKPTAICGVSEGAGGTRRAQRHLREILARFHPSRQPLVLEEPAVCIASSGEKFDVHGVLQDEATRQLLHELVCALLEHVPQTRSVKFI